MKLSKVFFNLGITVPSDVNPDMDFDTYIDQIGGWANFGKDVFGAGRDKKQDNVRKQLITYRQIAQEFKFLVRYIYTSKFDTLRIFDKHHVQSGFFQKMPPITNALFLGLCQANSLDLPFHPGSEAGIDFLKCITVNKEISLIYNNLGEIRIERNGVLVYEEFNDPAWYQPVLSKQKERVLHELYITKTCRGDSVNELVDTLKIKSITFQNYNEEAGTGLDDQIKDLKEVFSS